MPRPRLTSLTEALAPLQQLRQAGAFSLAAPITPHQMLIHLSQSIECSMRGYPQLKPAWLRATVGPLVVRTFLWRGQMKHNHAAPVPGEPTISPDGDLPTAWDRLLTAIADFQKSAVPPQPHFLFGSLSKADYDRIHAMHIADHLSAVKEP